MRATVDFLLHDWLRIGALTARPRFAEHSRETFAAVLDTCERIARERFAPFNRLTDSEEPRVDGDAQGEHVVLPRATHEALAAYVESGMLAAAQDDSTAACSCRASSRWRPTPSSARPASRWRPTPC